MKPKSKRTINQLVLVLFIITISLEVRAFGQEEQMQSATIRVQTTPPTDTLRQARNVQFAPTIADAEAPPGVAPEGIAWIPGGEFSMGSEDTRRMMCGGSDPMPDVQPIHRVRVEAFWIDATEATNQQFEKFVKATNYVTVAEQMPKSEDFPHVASENLVAGSLVFTPTANPVPLYDYRQWWRYQKGANWRHPEGTDSSTNRGEKYPVVHIAYADAVAYAKWRVFREMMHGATISDPMANGGPTTFQT